MMDQGTNTSYRVALPEFEGPLDLLLHLCKTNEIDIINIPIAFITEKYLEYLDVMQSLSVDLAADYLVMAATLAYLKARELVPTPEPLEIDEETGEAVLDPREELIRRLLEYRKYKDAAEQLGGRPIEGRNVFGRGMSIEGPAAPTPFADHSVWKLIEAFGRLLEKAGPKVAHEVLFDRVSISARINQIIDRLEQDGGTFRFDSLFDTAIAEPELRSQLVVTLLAILELARLKVVRVVASEDQETIFIAQVAGAALEEARRARITSDDEALAEDAADSADDAPEGLSDAAGDEPPRGFGDRSTDGASDGSADGSREADSSADSAAALRAEGSADASLDGEAESPADSPADPRAEGSADASLDDSAEGTADVLPDDSVEGAADVSLERAAEGLSDRFPDSAQGAAGFVVDPLLETTVQSSNAAQEAEEPVATNGDFDGKESHEEA
jgi:segregation and condensation protein A